MILTEVWVSERVGELWRHQVLGLFAEEVDATAARDAWIARTGGSGEATMLDRAWLDRREWTSGFVSAEFDSAIIEAEEVPPGRLVVTFAWLEHERGQRVYCLWHRYGDADALDTEKALGTYSSAEIAIEAAKRAVRLPGFDRYPDGFVCAELVLGKVYWPESPIVVWDDDPLN